MKPLPIHFRKNVFLFIGLFLFSFLHAKDVYVDDTNGNDSTGDGTISKPWKTIQKAANVMASGDVCNIRCGTYRETVVPRAGQSFKAYQNEYVLLTGADIVLSTAWSLHSGNIYKATLSTKVLDVFYDGNYMDRARYPNGTNMYTKDWWFVSKATFVSANNNTVQFQNGASFATDYWKGAWYHGVNGNNCFAGTMGAVTTSSGSNLSITDIEFRQTYNNDGFFGDGKGFLMDHLNCLDTDKEWHWQSNTLYFYAPGGINPNTKKVEVRTRIYAFDISVDNVTVSGINFKGASAKITGKNNIIDGCTFRYVSPWGKHKYAQSSTQRLYYGLAGTVDGTSGIHIAGSQNTIKNCYIANGWGALVSCRGSFNKVENNYIENSNWMSRELTVNIQIAGTDHLITKNTVINSNAMLIGQTDIEDVQIYRNKVTNNICKNFGYILPDGGISAIYRNGSDDSQGDVYAYNIILNAMHPDGGMGFYMDDGSQNITVHHNVINLNRTSGYLQRGIWFHGNSVAQKDIFVYNNTIMGLSGTGGINVHGVGAYNTGASYTNLVYKNNYSNINTHVSGTVVSNNGFASTADFVDPSANNFRLKSTASNAINKGVDIANITTGSVGLPDLGAYEFGGTDWSAGTSVAVPTFPNEANTFCSTNLSLNEEFNEELKSNNFYAFPNPVSDKLLIKNDTGIYKVQIYSSNGLMLIESTINKNEVEIDLSSFKSGVYFAKVETDYGTKNLKIIKK
jgi:Secretion system C-terminal sorting domain/Right handed beta helix region